MDRITAELDEDLVTGAGLLAAGGAPPWPAVVPLRAALTDLGPVPLVDASAIAADAPVLAVAAPGDRLPGVLAIRRVARAAQERAGRPCAAVVALEVGGAGGPAAVYAAAVLGLPCVDGDGARRGFARLDLTLFALAGLAATPAVVSDLDGNLVTVDAADNRAAHRLVRATAVAMGPSALVGAYPMTAAECAAAVSTGSLRYCVGLGAMLRTLRVDAATDGAASRSLAAHGTRLLFTGRIVHVARNGPPDAVRGTATVETTSPPVRTMRVDFQQGNLVASEDGVVNATVPDLISIIDAGTWSPAHTGALEAGRQVHVVAIPAHRRWRRADGIAAAGPRRFGYDIDYEPLEAPSPLSLTDARPV